MQIDEKSPMQRLVQSLPRILEYIGGILLFAMMALTFIDVIGRYVFSRPVVGAFEITEFMLATVIFFGIPLVTLRGGHITVDILDPFFPDGFRKVRDRLIYFLWAAALYFLGYLLLVKALDLVDVGEITQVLRWPIAPAAFLMAGMVFLAALIATVLAFTGTTPEQDGGLSGEKDTAVQTGSTGRTDTA